MNWNDDFGNWKFFTGAVKQRNRRTSLGMVRFVISDRADNPFGDETGGKPVRRLQFKGGFEVTTAITYEGETMRTKTAKQESETTKANELNMETLSNLLLEALETEKGGVLVYETALRCAINPDLKEEWQKYLEQTRTHVETLTDVVESFELDPEADTPGQKVVRQVGESLVATMELALSEGEPEAAEIVAAECVVLAETKDHLNWELIGVASRSLDGEAKETLQKAYEAIEDEEDEHLYHTTGWARELHLQALGLPAELPPTEEKKDVKSEVEAAAARKQRKTALTRKQSNASKNGE